MRREESLSQVERRSLITRNIERSLSSSSCIVLLAWQWKSRLKLRLKQLEKFKVNTKNKQNEKFKWSKPSCKKQHVEL